MLDTLPAPANRALTALVLSARSLPVIRALVLYGSAVTGGYRPGDSDLNVVVVAGDGDLAPLRAPLRAAWRAARVEPWIVRARELPRLADAFATRIRELQHHSHVLYGESPLSSLEVPRAALRLRLEQELRNHQVRLRRVRALGDDAGLGRAIWRITASLVVELALVEELAGGAAPEGPAAVAAAAARRLDVDAGALDAVLAYHRRPSGDVAALAATLEAALDRAVEVVDRLEV